MKSTIAFTTILLLLPLAGACGGAETDEEEYAGAAEEEAAAVEAPPSAPSPAGAANAPLAVADIDRWQRGREGELEAVKESQSRLASARTAEDSATAIYSGTDMSTRAAGASAAGLSEDRYRFVSSTLSRASGLLAPEEMPGMPPEMLEEAKQGRERALAGMQAELPPEVMEALRPRAQQLRLQALTLTGERLRLAGG